MSILTNSARNSASSGVNESIEAGGLRSPGVACPPSNRMPVWLGARLAQLRAFHAVRPLIDFKQIVRELPMHVENARLRNMDCKAEHVAILYDRFRSLTQELQQLEEDRNKLARLHTSSTEDHSRQKAVEMKAKAAALSAELGKLEAEMLEEAISIPNQTHPDSPRGSPEANKEVVRFGPPIDPQKDAIDHVELGKRLGILDFEAGARVAGAQHYFLKDQGALLELALIQYAISTCMKRGFRLMFTPDMSYSSYIQACGFNPRNGDSALPIYTVQQEEKDDARPESHKRALVGTAEVAIAAHYADTIIDVTKQPLPIKVVAFSHCFRPEVGHHGAESRGLYRVHQFSKVEMFAITAGSPEASQQQFDELVSIQKEILGGLGLSCRILNMATEELGASAYCKYDIEAWFPFGRRWGELTSASSCTDFQSRRLAIRIKDGPGRPTRFPHTLNGTAAAIPRLIQAIMENYQEADGTVRIPDALHPFMLDGSKRITKR